MISQSQSVALEVEALLALMLVAAGKLAGLVVVGVSPSSLPFLAGDRVVGALVGALVGVLVGVLVGAVDVGDATGAMLGVRVGAAVTAAVGLVGVLLLSGG